MRLSASIFKRHHCRTGQAIAEFALVMPLFVVFVMAIAEFGRVWQTFEAVKLAAMDGSYTASITQDIQKGKDKILQRLNNASVGNGAVYSITAVSATGGAASGVSGSTGGLGYAANVEVDYIPLFAGVMIPTVSGSIPIIPKKFPIRYQSVQYNTVY